MTSLLRSSFAVAAAALAMACSSAAVGTLPDPAVDTPKAAVSGQATAVFAGGCFWGVEAVFKHVKGVTKSTSGYSGGSQMTAKYMVVGTGTTGHAESVEVKYDPSQVTYGQLLRVFFSVAHDPTQLNRQGPDWGTQYRSAIFFATPEQERVAKAYIAQLDAAKVYAKPIVTEVAPLKGFYSAEDYHQDYLARNPDQPYIVINDLPKLAALKEQFPQLYTGK
jgi:peptide-methionine (S)-S-oxide reductase